MHCIYTSANSKGINKKSTPLGKLLQIILTSIPNLRIASKLIRVRILPEAVSWPTTWDSPRRTGIPGQNERTILAEIRRTPGTGIPPVGSGVDHRIPTRLAVIGIGEVLDPRDHTARAESVACVAAVRVVFHVEHSREGDPVVTPASSMCKEVFGLSGPGAGRGDGEVVPTTDETGVGGSVIVGVEGGIDIVGVFSGLYWLVVFISRGDKC